MVDRGWGRDDFSEDECDDLFDLISNAKLCLEELKALRSAPFDVRGIQSRLRQSEQENESLRTLLRCSEYDADQQAALELENVRLQLLLAKEQAEKVDAVKKHRLLLEMFRKSHTDIEAARDSLQALQRESTTTTHGHKPHTMLVRHGEHGQESGGSSRTFGDNSTSNSSTGMSDDCLRPVDQSCSPSNEYLNTLGTTPGVHRSSLHGLLGSYMMRGPECTTSDAGSASQKGSDTAGELAHGHSAAKHLNFCHAKAHATSAVAERAEASKRYGCGQSCWGSSEIATEQKTLYSFSEYGMHQQHTLPPVKVHVHTEASGDEEMPYHCVQHAVNWEATYAGHLHPPQILRVHVSEHTGVEHIADAEVYEGDVCATDEESSSVVAPSPTATISENGSDGTLSSCDSDQLHNCTVSLVDELLRDLRKTIDDGELWDHTDRACSV